MEKFRAVLFWLAVAVCSFSVQLAEEVLDRIGIGPIHYLSGQIVALLQPLMPITPHILLAILILLCGLVVATLLLHGPAIYTYIREWPANREAYKEWRQKLDSMASNERTIFWERIREAYAKFTIDKTGSPEEIMSIIKNVSFPQDLPLDADTELYEWITIAAQTFDAETKYLWEFMTALYPLGFDENGKKKITNFIDDFAHFDAKRNELAKFWSNTGKDVYHFNTLRKSYIKSHVDANKAEIKLLSFIDIAVALRNQTEGQGKNWMFELYKGFFRK